MGQLDKANPLMQTRLCVYFSGFALLLVEEGINVIML